MGITVSLHTRPCSAVVGLTGAQFLKCSIDGLNLSLLCVCVCVHCLCVYCQYGGRCGETLGVRLPSNAPKSVRLRLGPLSCLLPSASPIFSFLHLFQNVFSGRAGGASGWGCRLVFWSVLQHMLLSDPRRKTEVVS